MSEGIRVRATRAGFIGGQYKQENSEFTLLKPELFSKTWMERIEEAPVTESPALDDQGDVPAELTVRRRKRNSF